MVENTALGYKIAKKLLTFASAASTLVSRVTVAEFESMMMTHRFKGGEFY